MSMPDENMPKDTPETQQSTSPPPIPTHPIFLHPSAVFPPPAQLASGTWSTAGLLPQMLLPAPEGGDAPAVQYVMLAPHPSMMYAFPPIAGASGVQPYFPAEGLSSQKSKRKQVKSACKACAAACKKCDDERPCGRCHKYGIADSCEDQKRKERAKGIKRGPYKRRTKGPVDANGVIEGVEWAQQQFLLPFVSGAEGMQPYIIPPGLFPTMPGVEPTASSSAEGSQSQSQHPPPQPTYFPFLPPTLHSAFASSFFQQPLPPADESQDSKPGESSQHSMGVGEVPELGNMTVSPAQTEGVSPAQLEGRDLDMPGSSV